MGFSPLEIGVMSLIACGPLFFEDSRAIGKGEQKCKTAINDCDCRSLDIVLGGN